MARPLAVIGQRFRMTYGAVSKRVGAVAARMATDADFRQRVEAVLAWKGTT